MIPGREAGRVDDREDGREGGRGAGRPYQGTDVTGRKDRCDILRSPPNEKASGHSGRGV